MAECAYLHAFHEEDWGKCPPNAGPVRRYQFAITGDFQWYCDDAAKQVRDDGVELILAVEVGASNV